MGSFSRRLGIRPKKEGFEEGRKEGFEEGVLCPLSASKQSVETRPRRVTGMGHDDCVLVRGPTGAILSITLKGA